MIQKLQTVAAQLVAEATGIKANNITLIERMFSQELTAVRATSRRATLFVWETQPRERFIRSGLIILTHDKAGEVTSHHVTYDASPAMLREFQRLIPDEFIEEREGFDYEPGQAFLVFNGNEIGGFPRIEGIAHLVEHTDGHKPNYWGVRFVNEPEAVYQRFVLPENHMPHLSK